MTENLCLCHRQCKTHFCLSGIEPDVKDTGEICGPEDKCKYNGRCLTRCCDFRLAMPDNVAECNERGWMARCKSGHEYMAGKGCIIKEEDPDSSP